MIENVGRAVVWATWAASWTFVGLHTWLCIVERKWGRRPWWRTWLGWMWTSAVASIGAVMTFAIVAELWPTIVLRPWYQWSYIVAFSMVTAVIIGKCAARVVLHVREARRLR